jgi:hypothetical protein
MKKSNKSSKNIVDWTDSGPNGKRAKNDKRFLLQSDKGVMPTPAENRKNIANRKKLKETEKIVLGGMASAAANDKLKVKAMEMAKIKQMNATMKEMADKAKIKPTPVKAPIPKKRPKR